MSPRTVLVKIVSAQGLKSVALFGKNQPVAVAWVTAPATCSTRVAVDGGSDPVWNEELVVPVDDASLKQPDAVLKIQVFHRALRSCNRLIGTVHIPLADVVTGADKGSRRLATYPVRGLLRHKHGTLNVILSLEGEEAMSMPREENALFTESNSSTENESESATRSSRSPSSSEELEKTGAPTQPPPATSPQPITPPRPVADAPPLPHPTAPTPIPQKQQIDAVKEKAVEPLAESSTAIPTFVPSPHAQKIGPPEMGLPETPTTISMGQAPAKVAGALLETAPKPELWGTSPSTLQPKIKGREPESPCVLLTEDEDPGAGAHEYINPRASMYPESPYQASLEYPMALYPKTLYPPELFELERLH